MALISDKFRKARLDQSPYLFHFVKGSDVAPLETLKKILEEEKLISSRGYICFSASPLTAITKFFEVKTNRTGKPLYHPYGIGFSRDVLVSSYRARNVIYVDSEEWNFIPNELKWRTDLLNVDSYDFEYLREWRIKGSEFNFAKFPKEDMIVIAPTISQLNDLVVQFDMEFKPIVNYCTGDIEEDWDESFTREWKGVAINSLEGEFLDDYAISGATIRQTIGEDMTNQLFGKIPWLISEKNKQL